jgi:hypothetical protein
MDKNDRGVVKVGQRLVEMSGGKVLFPMTSKPIPELDNLVSAPMLALQGK